MRRMLPDAPSPRGCFACLARKSADDMRVLALELEQVWRLDKNVVSRRSDGLIEINQVNYAAD